MNRVQARTEMQRVLGDAASLLTSADEEAALDSGRVPDSMGRAPDADGYVETIDPWLAAADAADVAGSPEPARSRQPRVGEGRSGA